MTRLIKYLKPYTFMILVTIALLFVQANADLALPDYMSKIVNNGIQQGGIENAVPQAIRQRQMQRLSLFLSEVEYDRVLQAYRLITPGSANNQDELQAYPALASEPVYVLKDLPSEEIGWLNSVMGSGLLAVSAVEQLAADPVKAAAAAQVSGIDLSKLPPGADVFELLSRLPAEQRDQIKGKMNEQFTALGETMIHQAAVSVIKSEYAAIGMDTSRVQSRYILGMGGTMLLVTLVSVICTIGVGYLSARAASGLARDLRRAVFAKVTSFSGAEFERFSTASLITRSTNDINQIQMVVMMMLRMVIYAPIMGVGGIIRAMSKDSSMWWVIAVAVGILLALIGIVFALSLPKFRIIQSLIDRLNLVMRENLSGMMVIRAFNRQLAEQERFDKANHDLTDTGLFVSRVMATMFPSMTVIMNGLSMAIIWIGAHQVAQARMQVGDMMAFLQYAMQIVFSFLMMSFMFILLPRASVSGTRIAEVLDTKLEIRDPQKPVELPDPFHGVVEFRGVSFRYPGAEEDVLHDINFTAQPGQTTAFIGSTGSGKSTVLNLVPRFYDVTAGAVLLDGVDVRSVTQHSLRQKIGYIPQRSTLFSGTIESNLRYADETASTEVLDDAVQTAQAAEFVYAGGSGLTAEISQGGANISGGQKQRLSITRALVKQAPVYIFDDSFSALDYKTDAALRRALKGKIAQNGSASTLLIVSQRVSTIKNADQIIVLNEGRIVGKGTHQELMESCETYREIALSQLSAEELA